MKQAVIKRVAQPAGDWKQPRLVDVVVIVRGTLQGVSSAVAHRVLRFAKPRRLENCQTQNRVGMAGRQRAAEKSEVGRVSRYGVRLGSGSTVARRISHRMSSRSDAGISWVDRFDMESWENMGRRRSVGLAQAHAHWASPVSIGSLKRSSSESRADDLPIRDEPRHWKQLLRDILKANETQNSGILRGLHVHGSFSWEWQIFVKASI